MAKLSLATNFDDSLLLEVSRLNERFASTGNKVVEIFGSLPSTFACNTGRPAQKLPAIKFCHLARHVKLAHNLGLDFNYILNEVCLGGMEYSRRGISRISRFLDRLAEIKVDAITISNPFLARFIKNNYHNFIINISVICGIDSFRKAGEWIDFGADRLTLIDPRNFGLIKMLKEKTKAKIELRTNSPCLSKYSLCYAHYLEYAHTAKNRHPLSLLSLNCWLKMLNDPIEYYFKCGTWIRPEDLKRYDSIGVDIYKILDRTCTTKELLIRAEAYLSQKYSGNLLSLIVKRISDYIYVENQKLEGFIKRFAENKCPEECGNCKYCEKAAAQSLMIINRRMIKETIKGYKTLINYLIKAQ